MQTTINVSGDKITIKAKKSSTRNGNYNGYIVHVNDAVYRVRGLCSIEVAMAEAYVAYIKEYR